MARSNEVRYIRYYSAGSTAQKLELPREQASLPKPKVRRPAKPVLRVDGLAAVGTVVAAIMLICMVVGFVQVCHTNQQVQQLQEYVAALELEQDALKKEYKMGYDLDEVRLAAQSMGMIPQEQAQRITVSVKEPEVQIQPWWQSLLVQLRALFA